MPKQLLSLTFILVALVPAFAGAQTSRVYEVKALGDVYYKSPADDYNNGQYHGRVKLHNRTGKYNAYLDAGAGGLSGKSSEYYFIAPQAYVDYESEKFTLTFGRALMNFSDMDQYWNLGDVQPLFRWDAPHPEQQGLTGVFANLRVHRNIEFNFYGSGIYLPSQGPSYTLTGGKLTSGNPWFSQPIDILQVSGQPYDLSYVIDKPSVGDVIYQPSWSAGFTVKSDNENLFLRANYFSKSRNELVLPFEAFITLGPSTGSVTVHPVVAQHKITTIDAGYKSEDFSLVASGIFESDVKFDTKDPWIYPHYSDQYKVGLHMTAKLADTHTLELGGLRTFNNSVTGRGISGIGNLDIYSYRNQYDNAADVRLTSNFVPTSYGFLFKTKMRYAYDYEAHTSLVQLEGNYSPVEGLTAFISTDLFGGVRDLDKNYNNLLVNYLNRDRAQAGIRYVF